MDCAEEVSLLRRHLSTIEGIFDLQFDIFRGKMSVQHDPSMVSSEQIQATVSRIGMGCESWEEAAPQAPPARARLKPSHLCAVSGLLLLAGILYEGWHTGNLWMALLAHGHGEEGAAHGEWSLTLGCFLLAIVAGIYPVLPKALQAIRAIRPDMNVLVLVSIVGAGFLEQWIEAATLSFLFSLSGLLESWSMARARRAITSLMDMLPAEVTVAHADHDAQLPLERVAVGSRVRVKPGERIPCDGEVIAGESYVNQAIITGESVPARKSTGSRVFAGSMNGGGSLEIRTTRLASDTVLSRVLRMIESSGSRRAPSERFVDRFARYYTPAMFAVAAAVALAPPLLWGGSWSRWFYESMLVLLISCPCALVISTPVSFVSALTSAARRGLLIKGGSFLEEAARLKALALDKTGVLTQGTPVVVSVKLSTILPAERVLAMLAGVEAKSEHAVAQGILQYTERQGVTPADCREFRAIPGKGVEAVVDGQHFWIGGRRMLEDHGVTEAGMEAEMERYQDRQHTVVAFGAEREVWGLVVLEDPVCEEAQSALQAARRLGVRTLVLLTGDNQGTSEQVARFLALDAYHPNMLPEQKLEAVKILMETHGTVGMVGDGISDAAAMAGSSIGIALGHRGSDLAMEAADVVALSGRLDQLPFLIRHARRTLRLVRQNVAFALGMKAVFLTMTALDMATLWMAIAADTGATLLVTLNGLRMLRPERD